MPGSSKNLDPGPFLEKWGLTLVGTRPARSQAQIFEVTLEDEVPAILKVYRLLSLGSEAEAPKFLSLMNGAACVRLLRECPGALLLERLEGNMLQSVVSRGDDETATEIIIDIAEAIRKKRFGFKPARNLELRFDTLLKTDRNAHPALNTATFQKAIDVARMSLDRDSRAERGLLHGDLHHTNIVEGKREWCAIDPMTLYGEAEAEYGQAFCNPSHEVEIVNNPERAIRIANQINARTALSQERLIAWGVVMAAHSLVKEVNRLPFEQRELNRTAARLEAIVAAYGAVS
ncbi:hypothetical protein D9R08_04510 [Rhodophyticola porphyridii]|uniref:3'-kinase n=1 Tax=Rhodophyticola porphyridii TaxID=1852017 RepID=A0A3L9YDD6_9RHOB|nr:hypothetical protein D9R08_04510 [Rhodophyticola porphyridii]